MKKKLTIPQFKEMKAQGQRFSMVTAYDYTFARIVDKTPVEMILVGDSLGMVMLGYDSTVSVTMEDMLHHIKPVVRGARHTFVVGDMPFGSYNVSVGEAIRNANRIIQQGGADAIKIEGGSNVLEIVSEMVKGGIPVIGHIGLTPQTAAQLGGFKVQGKDAEIARRLVEDALHLEQAGVFALVLECVVAPIAELITGKVAIPTIGIGAGPACDAQVLVLQDLLGLYDKFTPKFVKQYAQLNDPIANALTTYAREVADGSFPGPEQSFGLNQEPLGRLY
ncbi:3-methyl-2-oxobutanoate hydroxymethyltransferase|uniref:3-methyl-2-oxobutanoate hydroxymethyltransferase n=1 Tax=Dendrosporobacter quercicolus TaxID=146817 RepID=A0A1G9RXS4_9FIRM|nr:3-methyl-2-oxobutanoate hydroxymethyltransferase [Dendrosporobacter quercicolus]NSL49312.1 3-methyl-2-oxobutanoate hydroxymethyltransferase [Dendrosporobacter quercicolus DSM 1736]SDM27810.1 ketopantoate hydroxymethyltransferase [Dendrosporobacter quercicolus]